MKKILKVVACLLIAITVALGMNVTNASAVVPTICDRSINPTCLATLEAPGDCVDVPLPGFNVKDVKIEFAGGPIPLIYPPPTVNYELEIGATQVRSILAPTASAEYEFNPATSESGQVCSAKAGPFALPFTVVWKNINEDLD